VVTRNVLPDQVGDLLHRPPRAAVTYVRDGIVEVVPVHTQTVGEEHRFWLWAGVSDCPAPGDLDGVEVVLTRDDGPYWWQLRAVNVRGVAERLGPDNGHEGTDLRYRIATLRVVAWDYGALRDE